MNEKVNLALLERIWDQVGQRGNASIYEVTTFMENLGFIWRSD